jgi:hypothetical protein
MSEWPSILGIILKFTEVLFFKIHRYICKGQFRMTQKHMLCTGNGWSLMFEEGSKRDEHSQRDPASTNRARKAYRARSRARRRTMLN